MIKGELETLLRWGWNPFSGERRMRTLSDGAVVHVPHGHVTIQSRVLARVLLYDQQVKGPESELFHRISW